jgi:hypothetical protein
VDEPQARRAAAFAVLAGSLVAQSAHVIGAAGQLAGVWLAPSAHAAASAALLASVAGWLASAAILAGSVRYALQSSRAPSVAVGVVAVAIALASYLASFGLGIASSLALHGRLDAWASEGARVGDALSEYTTVTSGASVAGGLLSIAFAAIALAWVARPAPSAGPPRDS